MLIQRNFLIKALFLFLCGNTFGQHNNLEGTLLKTSNTKISVGGYFRFLNYHRHVKDLFGDSSRPYVFRADDEFNSPTMSLELGITNKNIGYLKTQLYLFEPFSGIVSDVDYFKLNRKGISIEVGRKTKIGNLKLTSGGINFLRLSDFTLSSARQVRNSLFDRNAWTNVWSINTQYENYYKESDYERAADFGKRQFSGFHLDISEMPKQFGLEMIYGKTPFNILGYDYLSAIRIKKDYGLNSFSSGYMSSSGLDNTINGHRFYNRIINSTYKCNLNEWKLSGELAFGQYAFESENIKNNGIAAEFTLKPSKRVVNFPLFVEGYYISPDFANVHSSLINGSVAQFSSQTESFDGASLPDGARPFGAVMAPIHIKTNNRFGINLNTEFDIGKFKFNIGNGFSREIVNDTNLITFFHKVNGLYFSRVERFQSVTGPNNNLTTFFRGYYESLWIDSSVNSQIFKSFNVLLLNLKYQTKIFNRQLFLFYLGEFHSVQDFTTPFPVFTNKAFLRNQFHEIDGYLQLSDNIALIGYYGREFINANRKTPLGNILDSNNQFNPKRGKGRVYGFGLDYSISKRSCIYLRFKNVNYNDESFENEHYNGYEATAELKVFF